MSKNVRVRFAPSPTGPLHIGGVRTALFNYLFAKKHGGTFVLRIEDTDLSRYVEGAENYIIESLNWCGIPYDEGPGKNEKFAPYKQSERKHIYKQYADQLIQNGKAYYAFDTAEELDFHRKDHEAKGKTFIYNWHNREKGRLVNSLVLSEEEVSKRIANSEDYVIRFKSPQDETLRLKDIIRGNIQIDTNLLDDKILFKSDGMPTYHLANIVDDHLMQISHVIRGEEWLPSLALHVLLYRAFGWDGPEFAHLPLILKPTGKGKLSKRDGDKLGFPVFPLAFKDHRTGEISRGYREDEYFPEAVINFLAFLGWNPGTEQEIFSLEELIEAFDLNRVHKAGARFDPEKTKWYNHHYMQKQSSLVLAEEFKKAREELKDISEVYIAMAIDLVKERASFSSDFWDLSYFFFVTPTELNEKAARKAWKGDSKEIMTELISVLNSINDFSSENLQSEIKSWIDSKDIGFGKVMQPLRLALVGDLKGPDLFQIMSMVNKEETINRIENLINTLN
ncbi:MAG TPA: glutamate--tRNA ligase [Flavobacteriaceae bacterium]|nr:glutamate--tRNA ligase [Flavobacteriaceae bacterium]